MSVTDGSGQTPCSLEHYLVLVNIFQIMLDQLVLNHSSPEEKDVPMANF